MVHTCGYETRERMVRYYTQTCNVEVNVRDPPANLRIISPSSQAIANHHRDREHVRTSDIAATLQCQDYYWMNTQGLLQAHQVSAKSDVQEYTPDST